MSKTGESIMRNLLYAVLSLLILSQTVIADNKNAAEELLRNKLDAVILVLQNKDLEKQVKKNKIIEIVEPIFDFSLMAKLTLGRKYWPSIPKEKKERFTELFIKRLKGFYLDKLTLYTDETIVYKKPIQVKRKIQIPTELISKGDNISILYKLYKSKHNWKIYDIEVQGVSVVSTYRSQFYQVLNSGTIDDLLLKMEEPESK